MRFSTILESAALSAIVTFGAFCAEAASGTAWGRADATYELEPAGHCAAPPSYSNRTFSQSVTRTKNGWEISVTSSPSPVSTGLEPNLDWSSPALKAIDPPYLAAVRSALAPCRTQEEAILRLGLALRSLTRYAAKPGFDESPEEVSRRRVASCMGITKVAAVFLEEAFHLPCRTVIGIKAPPGSDGEVLSGGALHAWLEIGLGTKGRLFFDPWFSFGWVPESYIVLKTGGGFAPGDFAALAGARLSVKWRKDRIFYLPAENAETLVWAAGSPRAGGRAVITGKALYMDESPVSGTAFIEDSGGRVAAPLWNGNFCFRDLAPGSYDLSVESGGEPIWRGAVMAGALDIRELVVYSRREGGR